MSGHQKATEASKKKKKKDGSGSHTKERKQKKKEGFWPMEWNFFPLLDMPPPPVVVLCNSSPILLSRSFLNFFAEHVCACRFLAVVGNDMLLLSGGFFPS